jgi:hypothetical protein
MELTRNNEQSWIETIWQGLDQVLDNMPDDKADDIRTAMAWVCEELNNAGFEIDDQF